MKGMKERLIIAYLGNLFDTVATLHLYLNYEGEELNPIAAWTLQWPWVFVLYKLICMTLLVVLCWWKRSWRLCEVASWIVFVNYSAISVYYLIAYALLMF